MAAARGWSNSLWFETTTLFYGDRLYGEIKAPESADIVDASIPGHRA
jgi:hypothetical protein